MLIPTLTQATAVVTERLNASKPQSQSNDPKNQRLAINNNKDLDVDPKKEEQSFFSSFFSAGTKKPEKQAKKGVMEAPPPVIKPQTTLTEREVMETEVISELLSIYILPPSWFFWPIMLAELLIHSYFNIVKREMIDMVPKAISLNLVNHSKDNLQRELLQELYKPDVLDELLKESEYVVSRRREVSSMVQALNKAEEYALFSTQAFWFHWHNCT